MLSGSDVEMNVAIAPRADRPGRRTTAKKIDYNKLLSGSSNEDNNSSDDELVFKDNDAVKAPTNAVSLMSDEDSEDDKPVMKKKPVAKRPRSDSDGDKKVGF